MNRLLMFGFFLSAANVYAGTDMRCVNDCTSRGYQYRLCMQRCSFDSNGNAGQATQPAYDMLMNTAPPSSASDSDFLTRGVPIPNLTVEPFKPIDINKAQAEAYQREAAKGEAIAKIQAQQRELQRQQMENQRQQTIQKQSEYEQSKAEVQSKMKEFDDRFLAICAKPEYAPIFLKTSCFAIDITFEQLTDTSKISAAQRTILPNWRTEFDINWKERREYMHSVIGANANRKQWFDYLDSIQPEIEKYNLDLYKGILAWGEYNQLRKELTAKMMAEQRRVFAPH